MVRSLLVFYLILASVECRGAEMCRTTGFRMVSDLASGGTPPSIAAARRWLRANGQDAEKLYVAVRSTDGHDELDVIDEIQCNAESPRGCVGKFCATLVYDSHRDKIESVTYWR